VATDCERSRTQRRAGARQVRPPPRRDIVKCQSSARCMLAKHLVAAFVGRPSREYFRRGALTQAPEDATAAEMIEQDHGFGRPPRGIQSEYLDARAESDAARLRGQVG